MHDNLIILAGGASSRMKKQAVVENLSQEEIIQANERSKGLIGVGPNGRPLMDYLLLNAKRAGYKNIYIIRCFLAFLYILHIWHKHPRSGKA